MDHFEPFAPIDFLKKRKEEKAKDPTEELREELEELKRKNAELLKELQQLKFGMTAQQKRFEEEKKHLIQTLQKLENENRNLKTELQNLAELLERERRKNEELENITERLVSNLKRELEKIQNRLLEVSEDVLTETVKGILSSDSFHREEELKRIFENLFKEKIFIGEITVRTNPRDAEILRPILERKEKIIFDIVPDPNLKRGELEIETEKFFVERRYKNLVEEFVEELLREFLRDETQKGQEEAEEPQTGH